MSDSASLIRSAPWARLAARAADPEASAIRARLIADPNRFARFSRTGAGLLIDFSRTALDGALLDDLLALAEAAGLRAFLRRMAAGAWVNATERRAALHVALRAPRSAGYRARTADGWEDASGTIHAELDRMHGFVTGVHSGTITAANGTPFANVLNLGIGGSDLGPAMVTEALAHTGARLDARFVGNVDGHALAPVLDRLDPARTLVLIASKSFTTQETMANAAVAREWLAAKLGEARIGQHLAALSTNLHATDAFGIPRDRVFGFRDWVGGRFSLWSPIGLAIALARGWEVFASLLAGAHAMDAHALTAPPRRNLPMLLALMHTWHATFLGRPAYACLPYDQRLARLPAWLQQLEMESNGKRVDLAGRPVSFPTAPVVFGEPGTNVQHSFGQLLHQGTAVIPADLILVARPDHGLRANHRILLAHAAAQGAALALGRSEEEAVAELASSGIDQARAAELGPHRTFPGNRPTIGIILPRLDPHHLGALLSLYEHKVALQAALWGINAFDQWGVELGKTLAGGTEAALATGDTAALDPATAGLVVALRRLTG
ncbi:glucose-6-phosphate isomerase [Elioraea sp. Yellowstone]|jgi:glucose-6-phosphate isomerase|uniref:glucose-6-phosphate isomerase n=1 Tax=Elioraea sp. Yellowstone TaxID=2592070 RepID=UPI001152BC52|nr:glucose-6-phosphate isomerase [Elioraea sp. Yellowstone]TQF82525.1 glucose-6-phosphate isomerase [Elioraea sp. Yellowstone]